MEMENHMSEKEDSCYDNAEAAFSDDEDDLNSKGEECRRPGTSAPQFCRPALRAAAVRLLPAPSLREGGPAVSTVPFPTSRQTLFPEIQVFFRGKRPKLCCRLGPRSQTWQLCVPEGRGRWAPSPCLVIPLDPQRGAFSTPVPSLGVQPAPPRCELGWQCCPGWFFWDQGVLRQLLKRLGPRIAQPCGFRYTRSLSKAGIVLYSPSGARGISSWSWLWGSALGVSWRATPAVGRARRARLGQRT